MTAVGVLLPVRIETRFDTTPSGTDRLRVIVVPADIWFDRHDRQASPLELDLVRSAAHGASAPAHAVGDGPLPDPVTVLAQQLGHPRAAWLADMLLRRTGDAWSVTDPLPVEVRRPDTDPPPAVIRGLPGVIEVWATLAGNPGKDVRLGVLRPRPSLPVRPPTPAEPATFWPRWAAMHAAGLAVDIDLSSVDPDGPVDPAVIETLTVVGLSDQPPNSLLTAHQDAGVAALLPPGSPTNATPEAPVHHPGRPTADAPPQRPAAGPDGDNVSTALGTALTLPGGDRDLRGTQERLTAALWPALWGHALVDQWAWPTGADAERIEGHRWFERFLHPQGPFPTLLVGDQPYGLLPVTLLRGVAAEEGVLPPADVWVSRAAVRVLPDAVRRAESGLGTVTDADPERVLQLLAQTPVSPRLRYHWGTRPGPNVPQSVHDAQKERYRRVLDPLGIDVDVLPTPMMALGSSARVAIPSLNPPPGNIADWVNRMLYDDLPGDDAGVDHGDVEQLEGLNPEEEQHRVALLWLYGRCRLDAPEVTADLNAVLGRLRECQARPGLLVRLAVQSLRIVHQWARNPDVAVAADEVYQSVLESIRALATDPTGPDRLDRAVRATIDCATHRLDALPAGVALSRLEDASNLPRVLGVYGWVDRPYRGTPGFDDRGAVLGPSPAQTKAAAILRDRVVDHAASGTHPEAAWDLHLDSANVRRARGLLDDVREGAHPTEALGRQVEALLPGYDQVLRIRAAYPADEDAPGRRTCDGLALLRDWLEDRARFEQRTSWSAVTLPDDLVAGLDTLAAVPEVVADLHLLEAVHDTVQGGATTAAASLDALAGLGEVPELRAINTPVPGTPLTTEVLVCIPAAEEAGPEIDRPVLADPSFAALLDRVGDPGDPDQFGWVHGAGVLTLADLGLRPCDLAVVDDVTLRAAATAAVPDMLEVAPPPGVGEVRRLCGIINRPGRPAMADDPVTLGARYDALYACATELAADLAAAAGQPPDPDLSRRALRWGLALGSTASDAAHAAETLTASLDSLPAPGALGASDIEPRRALRKLAAAGQGVAGRQVVPVLVRPASPPDVGPVHDVEPWRHLFGRVRPALAEIDNVLADRLSGAWADGWDSRFVGRPVATDTDIPGSARVLSVFLGLDGASPDDAAIGVIDEWHETLPGRWDATRPVDADVPATMAFGFRTPGSRPPQAVLLVAPPTPQTPLDTPLVRAVLAETRMLTRLRTLRGRDLGPLGALAPSAWIPADADNGIVLDDTTWDVPSGLEEPVVRLEQGAPEGDVDVGLRAETADPLWLLARQWQIGEHQGENMTSPVWATTETQRTPLQAPADRPFADPRAVPGEAVLEAASRDWKTAEGHADPFDPTTLTHTTTLRGGSTTLTAEGHRGGEADWWSVDVVGAFHSSEPTTSRSALPGRMRYPGAPAPGWWTLEDSRDTVVAHLPDTAHVGSLFFLDVMAGHSTDWYLLPLSTAPGHVLSVRSLTVLDAFGDSWQLPNSAFEAARPWALYRTTGLSGSDLLVWGATPPALDGPVLERLVIGVDEDANLLWVVEEIVEGAGPLPDPPQSDSAGWAAPNRQPRARYQPRGEAPPRWHPYLPVDDTPGPRRFRLGALATRTPPHVTLRPSRTSRVIPADTLHDIIRTSVPARGLVVERTWRLARAADGEPVVWQQRRTSAPVAPPALRIPSDIVTTPGD